MATPPTFTSGSVLTTAQMNSVGLWLVKSQAVGTAVGTVSVTSAFSSDYENYKIIYSGGVGSTNLYLQMQFGIGTTWTTTNYYGGMGQVNTGGGTFNITANNGGNSFPAGGATTGYAQIAIEVQQPNQARPTMAQGPVNRLDLGNIGNTWLLQNSTTQFTSFLIFPSTGSITGGTIYVYGYKGTV